MEVATEHIFGHSEKYNGREETRLYMVSHVLTELDEVKCEIALLMQHARACRNWTKNSSENCATVCYSLLNQLNVEKTFKASIQRKQKRADRNNN